MLVHADARAHDLQQQLRSLEQKAKTAAALERDLREEMMQVGSFVKQKAVM